MINSWVFFKDKISEMELAMEALTQQQIREKYICKYYATHVVCHIEICQYLFGNEIFSYWCMFFSIGYLSCMQSFLILFIMKLQRNTDNLCFVFQCLSEKEWSEAPDYTQDKRNPYYNYNYNNYHNNHYEYDIGL